MVGPVRMLRVVDGSDDVTPWSSPAELAVLRAALARQAELVEELYEVIADAVPSYGVEGSSADREEMLHGIGFAASLFVATVFERRPPTAAERRTLQRIGGQRFRQGVTIDDLLAALEVGRRAGYRLLLTLVSEVAVDEDDRLDVAGALADRLSAFVPVVAAELGDGYRAAQAEPVIDGRAQAVLVDRVLDARWSDRRDMLDHGRRVGVDLTLAWAVVFLVPLGGRTWSAGRATRALGRVLGAVVVGQPRAVPLPHVPMLVRPADGESWDVALERMERIARAQSVAVAHVQPCDRLESGAPLWQQVDAVLGYVRLAWPDAAVVSMRRLAHLAVLAAAPVEERITFVREVLGELVDDPRLVDTLRATYEAADSSVDKVASRLHCHKNTVYQRWSKIERITGMDLAVPSERQELLNAFLVWRCLHVELDELDGPRGAPLVDVASP